MTHTKKCSKCDSEFPLTEYYKDRSKRDGLQSSCKSCCKESATEWAKANPERKKELDAKWAAENPERRKQLGKRYDQSERGRIKRSAKTARRRAAKLQRTPKWLTEEHKAQIEAFYKEAKDSEAATGKPHHVDHIVPLQGETVCGLHVPWNLQVLEASENCSKGNRL